MKRIRYERHDKENKSDNSYAISVTKFKNINMPLLQNPKS